MEQLPLFGTVPMRYYIPRSWPMRARPPVLCRTMNCKYEMWILTKLNKTEIEVLFGTNVSHLNCNVDSPLPDSGICD